MTGKEPVTQSTITGASPVNPARLTERAASMTAEERHLAYLRLSGGRPTSVYARKRALIRLAAWLEANGEEPRTAPSTSRRGPGLPMDRADFSKGLLDATPADLAAWRASLAVGDRAVVAYAGHVREFYRWCVAEGLITSNPAAGLPLPRLGRSLPRPIGEENLMDALATAPRRIRLMIVLAAWCGLRAREIALLRRECILETLTPPVLLVEAAAVKGGRAERVVPLSPFLLEEIALAGLPASGWVFRRMDGRPGPNAPWRVSQLCNRHLHRCGITDTLHSLRHRYGTQMYRSSRDLRMVQELLGHSDPATTAGYAAWDRAGAAEAANALPSPARLRAAK